MRFQIIIHSEDENPIVSVSPHTDEQVISNPNKAFWVSREEKEDFEKRGYKVEVLATEEEILNEI